MPGIPQLVVRLERLEHRDAGRDHRGNVVGALAQDLDPPISNGSSFW